MRGPLGGGGFKIFLLAAAGRCRDIEAGITAGQQKGVAAAAATTAASGCIAKAFFVLLALIKLGSSGRTEGFMCAWGT